MSIFIYDNYVEFLDLISKNYDIYRFKDVNEEIQNGIILRHDVDINIEAAYRLCCIENEIGIKSTYFILVSSEQYNIFTPQNSLLIKKMLKNGFEIGLHFDPSIYEEREINECFKKEIIILEELIETSVLSVSIHRPGTHKKYPIFAEYKNAYDPKYFNDSIYISDSSKYFRGKDIFEFIKKAKNILIQVLLHPIHFGKEDLKSSYIYRDYFINKINAFEEKVMSNPIYKNELNNRTLIDLICEKNILK